MDIVLGDLLRPAWPLLAVVLIGVTGCGEGRSAGFVPYSETSAASVENLRTGTVRPLTPVSASSEPERLPSDLPGSQVTQVPESPAPPGHAASQRPADGSPANGSLADGSSADGSPADGSPADGSPADGSPADGSQLTDVATVPPATPVGTGDSPDTVVSEVSSATGIDPPPPGDSPSDTSSSPADSVARGAELPAEPRTVQLLVPEKVFRPERNSPAVRVTYDDIDLLKILNMEPVPVDAPAHFPEWLRQLDGTTIRIRGFMYPTFEGTGLTAFTLARDNGICCFVRQPKIYDIIAVRLASGVTSDYIENKPFDVEGTFRIQAEADEKELFRLYRIENARVRR